MPFRTSLFVVFALVVSVATTQAQTTYTWNFGTTTANYLPSSGSNPNLSVGVFNHVNPRNSTGAIDNTQPSPTPTMSGEQNYGVGAVSGVLNTTSSTYFSFFVTPVGNGVTVSNISFGSWSRANGQNSGPSTMTIRSSGSVGGFATDILASEMTVSTFDTWSLYTPTLTTTSFSTGTNSPIEFRVYGYNGNGSNATVDWRIDDFSITLTPVPEPGTIFGIGASVLGIGAFVRRKLAKPTSHPEPALAV